MTLWQELIRQQQVHAYFEMLKRVQVNAWQEAIHQPFCLN